MATMFPTPLPLTVTSDAGREAELKVYDALGAALGPDHCVFYGVAWLSKSPGAAARDGEVDFVVAHPERGALLLEVKGGRIGRDQVTGEWRSVDRTEHVHPIRDPFAQVKASKHALLHKLQEHPATRRFFVSIGHGVVFPDSVNPKHPLAPDARPEITVFAEDLVDIGKCIDRMFEFWNGEVLGRMRLAPDFLQTLTDMLAPRFELRQLLNSALADDDRQLLRLTDDQFRVLDLLSRQRRVAVSGGAGTGKTLLALEKARRLAAEGFEVLLTCFNKPLADHLRRSAGPVERLTIANFHQYCWQQAQQAGIPLPDFSTGEQPPEFFDKTLPNALLAALDRLPQRFDAIVVDEGQDFLESWWDPLMLSMADSYGGVLYVFHDDNQQLYGRVSSFPSRMVEIPLTENLRNTRRIHETATKFYRGTPLVPRGPEGQQVERVIVKNPAEIGRAVSRVLHRLIREGGVPAADIAVLVGSMRSSPLKRGAPIGAFETTGDQIAEPTKVLLESVRRFKGLERPVIVLTGIDDLPATEEQALLYVGLSRARVHLVIVATEATMERVGSGATPMQGALETRPCGHGPLRYRETWS
jgi:hypothetical protein